MCRYHARRAANRIIATMALGLVVTAGCSAAEATAPPRLVAGDTVAADFSAVANATFDEFVAAAPGVARCIGSVRLEAAYELPDAARYSADTGTITVRVPATAPSLGDSLVHELGHHLEAACASHVELRPAFLEAQGSDPTAPWFEADRWEDTPSEQFAEAVVLAVLGQRRRNVSDVRLTPEAAQLVAEWLAG